MFRSRDLISMISLAAFVMGTSFSFGKAFPVTITKLLECSASVGHSGIFLLTVQLNESIPNTEGLLIGSVKRHKITMRSGPFDPDQNFRYEETKVAQITLDTHDADSLAAGVSSPKEFQSQLPLSVIFNVRAAPYTSNQATQILRETTDAAGNHHVAVRVQNPVLNISRGIRTTIGNSRLYFSSDAYSDEQDHYDLRSSILWLDFNPKHPDFVHAAITSGADLKKHLPLAIEVGE